MDDLEKKLNSLESELKMLKLQTGRENSHLDSEHGALQRNLDRESKERKEMDAKYDLIINGDGNGRPGLRIKLDRAERTIKELQDENNEIRKDKKLLWWTIISIAGTVVAGIIIHLLTK